MIYTIVGLICFVTFFLTESAEAKCLVDIGKKEQTAYGSDQQVSGLQNLIKSKSTCDVMALRWKTQLPERVQQNILILDIKNKQLLRIKLIPELKDFSYRWEMWSGATRDQILADDPSDGFDLPGFVASNPNQKPPLSPRIIDFLKKNGATIFLL